MALKFEGRLSREAYQNEAAFAVFFGGAQALAAVGILALLLLQAAGITRVEVTFALIPLLIGGAALAAVWFQMPSIVRRFHDLGLSGKWTWLYLGGPVIGCAILGVLWLNGQVDVGVGVVFATMLARMGLGLALNYKRGTVGPNRFGEEPRFDTASALHSAQRPFAVQIAVAKREIATTARKLRGPGA
jgi:uncharacterized membrane protein YhaH (DUF805 family)